MCYPGSKRTLRLPQVGQSVTSKVLNVVAVNLSHFALYSEIDETSLRANDSSFPVSMAKTSGRARKVPDRHTLSSLFSRVKSHGLFGCMLIRTVVTRVSSSFSRANDYRNGIPSSPSSFKVSISSPPKPSLPTSSPTSKRINFSFFASAA